MRLKFAAALALVAAPVFAAHAEDFTRDGETYHYVANRQPNGTVRLKGDMEHGGTFDLTVRNRRVAGTMNGSPVDFSVSRETATALNAEVETAAVN